MVSYTTDSSESCQTDFTWRRPMGYFFSFPRRSVGMHTGRLCLPFVRVHPSFVYSVKDQKALYPEREGGHDSQTASHWWWSAKSNFECFQIVWKRPGLYFRLPNRGFRCPPLERVDNADIILIDFSFRIITKPPKRKVLEEAIGRIVGQLVKSH